MPCTIAIIAAVSDPAALTATGARRIKSFLEFNGVEMERTASAAASSDFKQWLGAVGMEPRVISRMVDEGMDTLDDLQEVVVGLGRIVALQYHSSTSYHVHSYIRHLFF